MLYFVIFIMLNRVDNHIYVKYNTDIKNGVIMMKSSRLFVYSLLVFLLVGADSSLPPHLLLAVSLLLVLVNHLLTSTQIG